MKVLVIGSYQGVSIIQFPASPGIRQLQFHMNDSVAVNRSPFTGASQVQQWPGGDWWEADITLPQMMQTDAQVWTAFLAELRGMANVFYLGDPLHAQPAGNPQGAPVVSGVNNAMATTLNTKGWLPNTFRHLLAGDQIQVGYRLHRVLEDVSSDSSGNATLNIWPSLREATTDGQAINLNNPQGLFRLAMNKRSVLTAETRLSAISLKVFEAR